MSWLQSGIPWTSNGSAMTVTVPSGVVASQTVLIHIVGSIPAPSNSTVSSPGATFTPFVAMRVDQNMYTIVLKGSGLTAGAIITAKTTGSSLNILSHHYFDKDLSPPGTIAGRTVSSTSITAPALTVEASSTAYIIGGDRTSGTPSLSSVTNSLSSVTNLYYQRVGNTINSGNYLGKINPTGTTTGTSTITMNTASSNANAFHVFEIIPVPTVSVAFTSGFGLDYLRAGWVVSSGVNFRMVASTSSNLSNPIYSSTAAVPTSRWITAKITGLNASTKYYIGVEIDGTILVNGRLSATTLQTGVLSYVAITSSCQSTGANHVVFDQMATENAAFFAHQGDLHYADAVTETPWRAAFIASMSAPKFSNFISNTPMSYVFDNHDWAGQGRDASAWTSTPNPATMVREVAGEFPASTTNEIYHTWVHGRVRWIKLDQWSTRDPDGAINGPTKRMMSAEQEQWIYDTLSAATEPLIIFLSSWPMYHNLAAGRWASYPDQVGRIKTWLTARPNILKRMVAIGGDSHAVHADTGINQDALGAMPTLNASPLSQTGGLPGGIWNIGNIDVPDTRGYYSRITITDSSTSLTMKWDAVQDDGTSIMTYSKTVPNYVKYSEWNGTSEIELRLDGVWNGASTDPVDFDHIA